jgi:diacylglycerol kinase (ATP)
VTSDTIGGVEFIRPYIIVANRWAGSGKARDLVGDVERTLGGPPAAIVEPDLTPAFSRRLNEAVSHAASSGRLLLVCIGGDGTLSLTFDALSAPDAVTLAIVPCGSGNDLASALGVRAGKDALDVLRTGVERQIDYGTVDGRRFLNCVGIGLDAEVAAMAARIRATGLAKGFSYYLAALRGLLLVKPVGATIRTGAAEMRFEDLVMVTIGNGAWYGGGFRGAPHARLDDGVFDCYAFRDVPGLPARMALMQRIRSGTHADEANVMAFRANRIELGFERRVAMHIDGELAHTQRATIELVPLGARILTVE